MDPEGRPVGIVRVVDLAHKEVRDPLLVRSAIGSARTIDALIEASRSLVSTIVELREQGVPATYVGAVHAAVVDEMIRRALVLAANPVLSEVRPGILHGSFARREPLP